MKTEINTSVAKATESAVATTPAQPNETTIQVPISAELLQELTKGAALLGMDSEGLAEHCLEGFIPVMIEQARNGMEFPDPSGTRVQPAGPGTAVVDSVWIDDDGHLTIVCTPRASELFMAGAWLHRGGNITEHASDMIECHVERDILDSGLEPGELFTQPATEHPATVAA